MWATELAGGAQWLAAPLLLVDAQEAIIRAKQAVGGDVRGAREYELHILQDVIGPPVDAGLGHRHGAVVIEPSVVQVKLPEVELGRDEASSALELGEGRDRRDYEGEHVTLRPTAHTE